MFWALPEKGRAFTTRSLPKGRGAQTNRLIANAKFDNKHDLYKAYRFRFFVIIKKISQLGLLK